MTDNQLIAVLISLIQNGMTDDGFLNIPIVQAFQPTQQGVNTQPTIFLDKRKDYWYGWKESEKIYDPDQDLFIFTEKQRIETTFAIRALAIQNPEDPSLPTASDLVNEVGNVLRSQQTLEYLATLDLGMLRTTDVSNEYDLDDRDQFEAAPTFITTLVHSRTRIIKVPVVESTESVFARV